jgi:hypothetical protein
MLRCSYATPPIHPHETLSTCLFIQAVEVPAQAKQQHLAILCFRVLVTATCYKNGDNLYQ